LEEVEGSIELAELSFELLSGKAKNKTMKVKKRNLAKNAQRKKFSNEMKIRKTITSHIKQKECVTRLEATS
jgi:hypothetical protein